ncbi:MAG: hypothetical protein BM485_15180 [Desulfobulbaceae bacterium DB1]|nr:MAG: hypothetical protein BM485_15180 [Desulfobulbaceae bacterium DB1]
MAPIKKGSKVKIYYTGKFKDGTVFETNIGQEPLQFVVGKGKVIKGFDRAVMGMDLGQRKTVTLKPAEAYGPRDPDLVWSVKADDLPPGSSREIEAEVSFTDAAGNEIAGRITAIENNMITIDGNHPLAGRNLTFELRIEAIS